MACIVEPSPAANSIVSGALNPVSAVDAPAFSNSIGPHRTVGIAERDPGTVFPRTPGVDEAAAVLRHRDAVIARFRGQARNRPAGDWHRVQVALQRRFLRRDEVREAGLLIDARQARDHPLAGGELRGSPNRRPRTGRGG